MNWVAVEDRLPPHGEEVLAWSVWDQCVAIFMNGTWYRSEEGLVMTREYQQRCARGCCWEWETEEVEVDNIPTHWCEINGPDLE